MRFTKKNNQWYDEDESLIVLFFEETSSDYLEKLKRNIVAQGVDKEAVHTLFVTETKFGLVSVEPGHPITGLDWLEQREEAVIVENNLVFNVIQHIDLDAWDGIWFYGLMSTNDPVVDPETGDVVVLPPPGLRKHNITFTDDRYCEIRRIHEPKAFFVFRTLSYIDDLIPADRDDLWAILNEMRGEDNT